ncbi:fibronectin type III domain-containing protein [Hymenobacter sp. ASUV-10]|uniref:Fibronectin type III domain-containing protein n=1 Tax=Hymenobacter aranciens TaxID=3063996 RepID=A0ABT9BH06_9BACT|nr:fibronectin type III domain-containing protein [Hymenobacter sp. ASUV-10]MDO7877547.1 fibronectin type III domain-containing protein [Hymenobacter sp. ASUV-10]
MSISPLHDRTIGSAVTARRWLLGLGLGLLSTTALQAQSLNYTAAGAANVAGTYADLGTTGTVITTSGTDDALSAAQTLPFSFSYNGASFTDFSLSTNGFIKLGTTPLSAATLINAIGSANVADVNILAPLSNVDLQTSTAGTAEYRYATTGTAPNRVTTIQWKNVADKATGTIPAQFTSMQFQVKLYETSNRVEFVYGTWVANAATPTGQGFVVGLKGSSNAIADRLFAAKPSSATAWSTTTFSPGTTATLLAHFVRNTFLPDAGRTYRFNPASANDAGVTVIYTLGKVASAFNSPVTVQARVSNTGSNAQTNLPVTLTVSGATTYTNTQTVATLAAGTSTTVTFPAYAVTGTTGTNTVTVSVPADDATGNDSKTYSQLITANDQSYIDSSQPLNPTGVGVGAANGILLVRQHTNTAATVTSITPTFVTATGASTTYQVVIYDATGTGGTPGAALYTSPTQTRPASGPAVVAIPNIAVNGDFFIGTKELDANNIVIGYQLEVPLKPATYFFSDPTTPWTDVSLTTLQTRLALEVGLSPAATGACDAVTALTVGSITDNTASVSFTPGTGASGYTVTYTPAGGTATTVNATGSPVALTGLTAGVVYSVTVTANCTAGGTSAPATTSFTTTGGVGCPPVTAASVGTITGFSGVLTFTPAAGAVDYDVEITGGATPITGTVTGSPVNITGLAPGTNYTLTITTNCASGVSSVVTVTFTTSTVPAPANDNCAAAATLTPGAAGAACSPTAGTVSGASQSIGPIACAGFTADFAQDVWYQFTATFTEHTITTDGGFDGVLEVMTGNCTTPVNFACGDASIQNGEVLALTGLTVGTTYLVRYYPFFENQDATDGAFTICVTTPANATVCSPVTALSVGSITANSASVSFTPGAGNTSYTVTYTPAGGTAQTVTPAPSASPVALTGLNQSTTYTVSVTPVCSAGGSAPAVTTTFVTPLGTGTRAALAGGFVSVFPNPAHQSFTVAIPAVSGARTAQVAIINTLGQVVRTQAVSLSATATQTNIDATNLAAGIYTVRVKAGNETANVRLTIQ